MRKSYSADCFQCGKSRTYVKSFIGDYGEEGYFCNSACLREFKGKAESSEEGEERIDYDIDSIRKSLTSIISPWVDEKYNEHHFAYLWATFTRRTICGGNKGANFLFDFQMSGYRKASLCPGLCQTPRLLCYSLKK